MGTVASHLPAVPRRGRGPAAADSGVGGDGGDALEQIVAVVPENTRARVQCVRA